MTQNRSAGKARSHLSEQGARPSAHVVPKPAALRVVNGRLVGKTLADPDVQAAVKRASKIMFPDRESFIKEMHRRGVMTATGKVSKKYGG